MLSVFFKKLLMAKHIKFMEGDITVFDIDYEMHPLLEHQHLYKALQTKYGEQGTQIIYETGKSVATEIAATLHEKFKLKGLEHVNLWQNIIELNGMAKISSINPREKGEVTIKATSSKAKQLNGNKGAAKPEKADPFLAGFLAGIFSHIYDRELDCRETECMAQGAQTCVFEVRPKQKA